VKKFGKFLKGAYLGIVVLFMYLPIAVMLVMSFTIRVRLQYGTDSRSVHTLRFSPTAMLWMHC